MRTWILALLILVGGVALAQSAASVGVGIHIPVVVGLRLAEVEGPMVSALELGPGVHTLRLVANTQCSGSWPTPSGSLGWRWRARPFWPTCPSRRAPTSSRAGAG